jgi:enterochelin esterase-like enzyme
MGWMQFGEAHMIADEAIGNRQIPPMILAMPDGGHQWSYWRSGLIED